MSVLRFSPSAQSATTVKKTPPYLLLALMELTITKQVEEVLLLVSIVGLDGTVRIKEWNIQPDNVLLDGTALLDHGCTSRLQLEVGQTSLTASARSATASVGDVWLGNTALKVRPLQEIVTQVITVVLMSWIGYLVRARRDTTAQMPVRRLHRWEKATEMYAL